MTFNKNNIVPFLLGAAFFICLFVLFQPHMNRLPYGMHNWAQSDRYSVAVQYLDNNNFLKASTHNLSTIDGRVGVEFPLVQYTSAKLSKLFGKVQLAFIYRLTNLLLLLGGLFFFGKQWKTSKVAKVLLAFILFFSPVILFYSYNFLPDIAGLGFLLFGFGYFAKYTNSEKLSHAILSLLYLGLATLVKTTSGIYFLAVSGTMLLHLLRPFNWKKIIKIGFITTAIGSVIFLYDYYFFHKVNEDFYSRIFMSQQQPINDAASWKGLIRALKFWHGQFITWPQSLLVIGLIAFRIFYTKSKTHPFIKTLLFISTIGLIGFMFLMGKQFSDHDYYFITSWIPLFFLLVWAFLPQKNENITSKSTIVICTFLTIILGFSVVQSIQQYNNRMSPEFVWKKKAIGTDIEWMLNGERELNKLGIPADDIIFIGYDAAPNTSLVYFNRMGKAFNHEEMTRDSANMTYWMGRIKPDYFIVPSIWNKDLHKDQPTLYKQLVPFAVRDNFVIYKPIY